MTIFVVSKKAYLNELAKEAFRIIEINSKFHLNLSLVSDASEACETFKIKKFFLLFNFLFRRIWTHDSLLKDNPKLFLDASLSLPDDTVITFVSNDFSDFTNGFYLQFVNLYPHRKFYFFNQYFPPKENFEINLIYARFGRLVYSQKVIFANSLDRSKLKNSLIMNTLQLISELINRRVFPPNTQTAQKFMHSDIKSNLKFIVFKANFVSSIFRYLSSFLFSKFWTRSWKIGIYSIVKKRTQFIKSPPGRWFADPFLFEYESLNYLFFEDFSKKTNRGSISFSIIKNGQVEPITPCVLEDFHLSFPRIFVAENEIFMSVESVAVGGIRIYRALEFPFKWELEVHALKDLLLVDPMIIYRNKMWFLLVTEKTLVGSDYYSRFKIFTSRSPLVDSWNPHPMNPIFVDCSKGRNGGLLQDGDNFIRFGQKFHGGIYGSDLQEYSIIHLDSQFYQEVPSETIKFKRPKKFKQFHTYSVNSKFEVFDFK
jgi:hypothetical protein